MSDARDFRPPVTDSAGIMTYIAFYRRAMAQLDARPHIEELNPGTRKRVARQLRACERAFSRRPLGRLIYSWHA